MYNTFLNINNVTDTGKKCQYLVARSVDGKLWFWGGFNDFSRACQCAVSINGTIIKNDTI